jgi:uncharacterized protein
MLHIKKVQNISKLIVTSLIILTIIFTVLSQPVSATIKTGVINSDALEIEYRNVTVYAPAVGESQSGYIGVISTITVTIQSQGSGRVFVDTLPLAQIDMQGSARLAVKVASSYVLNDVNCSINPSSYDYFFVIRTNSPIIGGPSAGAIMTAAVISLLEDWNMDEKTVMTGMINPDGSIGPIGGIPQKIDAANSVGANRFLIPEGQETYTEQIIETINTPWGTQIVTHNEQRYVSDYARDNYGIEVIEAEDIDDVMLYYTGHERSFRVINQSSIEDDYIISMEPLATSLIYQANNSLQNASLAFENTTIPHSYFFNYRGQIQDSLNNAEDTYKDALDWYDQQKFYTSTSKSFQSLINTRFVIYACDYFNAADQNTYIQKLLNQSTSYYTNQSKQAKQAIVQGAVSLQCIGAAQKRATEAASYLSTASSLINQNEDFSALYQLAFTVQRAESISWWLSLIDQFNETQSYTDEEIENFATDYIQDAQQSIIYASVILDEVGSSSSFLNEASSMLESAKDDKNDGYPAAALFEALEALAKANLALELVDATTQEKIESKINRANQSAYAGIIESRMLGIEPILAVSYYEYAESLIEENVQNALFYYKYSDLLTGVLTVSGSCDTNTGSRYVGIPERGFNSLKLDLLSLSNYIIIFGFIGLISGILIGVLLTLLFYNKQKTKKYKDNQISWSSTQETHYTKSFNQQNNQTYPSLPTNINDYYKKTK